VNGLRTGNITVLLVRLLKLSRDGCKHKCVPELGYLEILFYICSMKRFDDILIYKDFNYKTFHPKHYSIEIVNDKCRVINNNPVFGEKAQSRLTKLHCVGKIKDVYLYSFKVNGNFVFIKLKYSIFN
jgi:hypothetical protein